MPKQEIVSSDSIKEALIDQLEAPPLDPVVLGVANLHLEGMTPSEISQEMDLPSDIVSQILDKKEVKSYVDNVYLAQGYMSRMKRINLINQVINAKIQEALETEVYSKKDLLDWLKLLHDMEKETKPKSKNPAVAVQINNNYEALMDELLKEKG